MKIGIHYSKGSFCDRWVKYCDDQKIPYKLVNCHQSDIIFQLNDCDALMWHHYQTNPTDLLIAKPILFSLEQAGKALFPDFFTNWHFDDKLGQKYLLEALGAPLVKSFAFFNKQEALEWAEKSEYPIVYKLRRGAGSANVKLVNSFSDAKRIINKAFGNGITNFDSWEYLKEGIRKKFLNKGSWYSIFEGIAMIVMKPRYARMLGREYGYVYFQEFIPGNNFDIRVIVIGDKAFAIKRLVRENDFRASGSGLIIYGKENFNDETIQLAFNIADKLSAQTVAFDFVYKQGEPLILEISYGFVIEGYDNCAGYWDKKMNWHEGPFNPYGWMVEDLLKNAQEKNTHYK
jgi:glutathione synthase/RimK-type ligase-like ATP-grasp enzyme